MAQTQHTPGPTFKVCRCCGTKASLRKRICERCGVPAIWDKPTKEQQAAHAADIQRREDFMNKLLTECGE